MSLIIIESVIGGIIFLTYFGIIMNLNLFMKNLEKQSFFKNFSDHFYNVGFSAATELPSNFIGLILLRVSFVNDRLKKNFLFIISGISFIGVYYVSIDHKLYLISFGKCILFTAYFFWYLQTMNIFPKNIEPRVLSLIGTLTRIGPIIMPTVFFYGKKIDELFPIIIIGTLCIFSALLEIPSSKIRKLLN